MRFGCCIEKLEHLNSIRKIGFDYAEISVKDILIPLQDDNTWKKNKEVIQRLNFPIEVTNSLLNIKVIGEGINYLIINNYLKRVFERAKSVGIEIVGFGSGYARTIPEKFSKEKASLQLERFLKMAIKHAERNSIIVGLEPLNKQETNFINTLSEAVQVIKKINNPYLRLIADFYHIYKEKEKIESLVDVKKELIHTHISDSSRKCPGTGNYDFRDLPETLKKINYNSRMSVECKWNDFKELKNSFNFLYNLLS